VCCGNWKNNSEQPALPQGPAAVGTRGSPVCWLVHPIRKPSVVWKQGLGAGSVGKHRSSRTWRVGPLDPFWMNVQGSEGGSGTRKSRTGKFGVVGA
jgi:hypothetical protein